MPTNVVSVGAPAARGNIFQTMGPGLQGLAALLASTMGDKNGTPGSEQWKQARTSPDIVPQQAVPVAGATAPQPDLSPIAAPLNRLPMQPVEQANPFGAATQLPQLGAPRPGGLGGILPSRFPGLFPSYAQYGGL